MVQARGTVWEWFHVVNRWMHVHEVLRRHSTALRKVHELTGSVSTLSVHLEGVAEAQGSVVGHVQPATVILGAG